MKRILSTLGLILLAQLAFPQGSPLWKKMKLQYPDEAAVYLNRSTVLNLLIKNDSLLCFSEVTENVLFLKENVDLLANKRIYGSYFENIISPSARTLVWNGSRYKELAVTDFKMRRETDNSIFYDDSYFYSFSYPAVALGNQTVLNYRQDLTDPRFLSNFYFAIYSPQAKTSFTIKASKGVELVHEVINDTKGLIKFREYEKGGFMYYEWSAESVAALKTEENSPNLSYFVPELVFYVKSYPTKQGRHAVLSDLNDLYKWYRTHVSKLDEDSSPSLEGIVKQLVSPGDTESEIVQKIFYWVQDNVRYIAFEDGMRGLVPHPGSYVCEKRYGDCKDMANLIVTMLRLAGVNSYRTWIGTRSLPYRYTKFPTPIVDNHMIATFISKDHRYYFLDATSNFTPFGLPSSMIQGKEALIGLDATNFEVKVVPQMTTADSKMIDSVSIHLENGSIIGAGKSYLTGYTKVFGSYHVDKAQKEAVKENVVKLVSKGSNKFYLDDFSISNLHNRGLPLLLEYKFHLSDYVNTVGDEIYINLNLNKDYYNDIIPSLREQPKENEYAFSAEEIQTFTLPEGYSVEFMPPNRKNNGEYLGFEITYELLPGKILMRKVLYVNFLVLYPEQFPSWNASVKAISEAYKESIILKKK